MPSPDPARLSAVPALREPEDFDAFWTRTLEEADSHAQPPRFTPADCGPALLDTYDVTFTGYGGAPVRGWLRMPAGAEERAARTGRGLACVVEFLGYGRGRGLEHENTLWACDGYAHLLMDTRGQGWSAAVGDTPDPVPAPHGAVPGFLTRGLESPEDHYYRRLFTDAVRCVATARAHPAVDPARIAVTGVSQGGGIALAVSGLVPGLAAVMPDVPFLSDIPRGVAEAEQPPYTEIAAYLSLYPDRTETAFATLAYLDAAVHASRASAPSLFSVALRDGICPPAACRTAFDRYAGPKELREYPFNGHEGGGPHHQRAQRAWLRTILS
ncbi:acetylxylan esterase [Streptomyces tubbatahanensis]|uniref:Acetylxylan esterase n=1 Tax=Streptomyces tubbatahanensis TaxID=2923272 RepID=A0ABY3XW70_9ACTN|nr:acetylxylan esterase [Streptomyces tubbatahanensis]UNS98585.1 acetylxylan esterase [Streptomyces tubbatahanensis]